MYGQRTNFSYFITSFLNIIIVADAGYFTIKNLYFIFIHRINALIMPNTEARKENEKLKEKNRKILKKKNHLLKNTLKELKEVMNVEMVCF